MGNNTAAQDISVVKMLFIDDRFIAGTNLERVFMTPEKHPANPVIRADKPWEKDAAFVDSGLVIYDEEDNLFKAWYEGGACYGPDDGSLMCYAYSADGVNWIKPELGLIDFNGSRANNIVLQAQCMMHDPSPIIDPVDPDPSCRFKAVWWGGRKDESQPNGWLLGHCVGFSPDGIHWTEHPDNPVWRSDAEVAVPFRIEHKGGRYLMFCSADGYGKRITAYAESDDFVHWELPPIPVIQGDDDDAPGTEVGGITGIDYYGTYLGFIWGILNLGGITREEWNEIIDRNKKQGYLGYPIELNNTRCRIMYTELITSLNGKEWQRIHRQHYIPMGGEGEWDETICLAGRPIVVNDKIYIYYTGMGRAKQTPGAPPEKLGQWNVDTGLATLRLDGFACLEAKQDERILVTKPFRHNGTDLLLNLDAPNGSVVVEVVGEDGQPVQGFARKDALMISGDHLRAEAAWAGNAELRNLGGREISLRVYARQARLYSLTFADLANV